MTLTRLGALAALFYLVHAGYHLVRGTGGDLFWACNVAVPLLAIGCFIGERHRAGPLLVASGFLWLTYGLPMWILDISTGGDFVPTSLLTHFGGTTIGVLAVRRLGWPRRAWMVASAGTLVLLGVTRLFASPINNPNLAFRIHDGWEKYFGSHAAYLALMWSGSALVFFVVESIARRWVFRPSP